MFGKPRVLRLVTGRPAVTYTRTADFRHLNVLVLHRTFSEMQLEAAELAELLDSHPATVVFANDTFEIYRFEK